jgi:hypothetical protein
MERNRRREINVALASLRGLILEDDRSLLSRASTKNQRYLRRKTSMIVTLRAARYTVLRLNDAAQRAHKEHLEQIRRRDRFLKRLAQLQALTCMNPEAL